jgi:hypothetical protein
MKNELVTPHTLRKREEWLQIPADFEGPAPIPVHNRVVQIVFFFITLGLRAE